mmetsp:Transcript_31112/g.90760  ORF Transcript_31112/g.90760 Transcript_31112/m.90760 type:complete len:490 (+) Transcript_31112:140-1609(+)
MAESSEDESSESSYDEEELEWEYEEAVNEVVDLQAELRAAEAETKQLRMRLQAATSQSARTGRPAGPALGPGALAALPAAHSGAEQRRIADVRTLLEWLAQHVQLGPEHPAEVLDVGFEVPIAGRTVHLRKVAQWAMPTAPGGRLRLSVPVEHQESVAQLIAYVKACGGRADPEASRRFAAVWDLVPGELATGPGSIVGAATTVPAVGVAPFANSSESASAHAVCGGDDAAGPTLASGGTVAIGTCRRVAAFAPCSPEPSVLLAHRGCTQGILVANWPTKEALETFTATSSGAGRAGAVAQPNAPRASATSMVVKEAVAADLASGGSVTWTVGSRVEVEYEGRWYSGTFHGIDGEGKATIRCDTDPDGVLTVAPLCRIRPLSGGLAAPSAAIAAMVAAGASQMAAAVAAPAGAFGGVGVATTARAVPTASGHAVGDVASASAAVVATHGGRRLPRGACHRGLDPSATGEIPDTSLPRPPGHRRTRSSAL